MGKVTDDDVYVLLEDSSDDSEDGGYPKQWKKIFGDWPSKLNKDSETAHFDVNGDSSKQTDKELDEAELCTGCIPEFCVIL